MADIFISYATDDRPFARRLADALEARGWSVWWDHRNLRVGEHFDRIIEEAICSARVVVVVWSKTSVESGWVRDEATLALEEKKLVPLRIDMARLPMRFRNIHTIDLSSWIGETEAEPFKRLVEDLRHYLGPSNPSDPDTRSEPTSQAAPTDISGRVSVGGNQQPVGTASKTTYGKNWTTTANYLQASPNSHSVGATARLTSLASRKHVSRYFAAVAIAGGILWGVVVFVERQQAPIKPPTEASVQNPPTSVGDTDTAQAAYARSLAERGDPVAQYNLGVLYAKGQGVPQDMAQAMLWYRKAADQGYMPAQYNLGVLYAKGLGVPQDMAQAMLWYRKAADQGYTPAQNDLGVLYANGQGVPQDYAEAMLWYRKAADQGYTSAQYNLGLLYAHGRGVPQDYAEAMRWYRKAADQGYTSAQYNLGVLYANGQGVPQDMAQARTWMQKAAAAGFETARNWLKQNR